MRVCTSVCVLWGRCVCVYISVCCGVDVCVTVCTSVCVLCDRCVCVHLCVCCVVDACVYISVCVVG